MAIFEPIKITFRGKEYEIPPTGVLRAIAKVEDVIPYADLTRALTGGSIAKLSMAYGALLRHVGVEISDDEVYDALFSGDDGVRASAAVSALMALMIPPARLKKSVQASALEVDAGKALAGEKKDS